MDTSELPPLLSIITFNSITFFSLIQILFFILLLLSSALVSGSEVAFFSFTPENLEHLKKSKSNTDKIILKHLDKSDYLLATILIANTFINIAIVILTTYISSALIDFHDNELIKFLTEAVFVTFMILLFGEIIPKIYANKNKLQFARIMAYPLYLLQRIFYPLPGLLAKTTNIVNKRMQKKEKISMSDISYAVDLTIDHSKSEKKIIKSVITLSSKEVREIMTPRVDVVVLNYYDKLSKIKEIIANNEFSRLPVYKDNLDNIEGVLYIKDLVQIFEQENYHNWQRLIKPAYFVPENKKLDDLLQEFKMKKVHLAIVVDEYGGFSGIITLEDIIEEIVGEINDEFDIDENMLTPLDKNKYIVDGKLLLNDLQKYLNLPSNFFDEIKNEVESVAGLILEILGEFPKQNQKIKYKNLEFQVKEISRRRIVKLLLSIKE